MPAFCAPDGTGTFPVLIMMHERYGLVQHTKDLARRAAADGTSRWRRILLQHPRPEKA